MDWSRYGRFGYVDTDSSLQDVKPMTTAKKAPARRKSTIKIPVHVKTGDVPHWIADESWLQERIESRRETLAEGFQNPRYRNMDGTFGEPMYINEAVWKGAMQRDIEIWTYEWREPWEFVDTYQITGYSRGRSAAYFNLVSKATGMKCSMFLTDMTDILTTVNINKGKIKGRWIFVKRGQNYGIKYLGDK